MSFDADLAAGKSVEQLVAGLLRKRYPNTRVIEGKFSGYDIWIEERNVGVEVKYDPASHDTGNYVIEYRCNSKPSGMAVTQAGCWMIVDNVDILAITPEAICRCIVEQRSSCKSRTIQGPGDPYTKDVYLIRKEALRRYGRVTKYERNAACV